MELIRSWMACGRGRGGGGYTELIYDDKVALYSDNKPYTQHDAMSYHGDSAPVAGPATRTVVEIADDVARLLWQAGRNDDALQCGISEAVGDRRWNRRMVEECLDNVIEYVEQGRAEMGDAMCAALDKATDFADYEFAFPRRHPQSVDGFIAIVSIGILAEMQGAWVLELLGFGEVSGKEALNGTSEVAMLTSDKIAFLSEPRPGSVAAWWAREYQAYIPIDSVYLYLQSFDMVELQD